MDFAAALDPSSQIFWKHIGTACLCGAAIGLERQLRGKVAGMRTSILICLGTAFFVTLGIALTPPGLDPTRVLGQVVTGIGFVGAGVILARGDRIVGVTTAAVIWLLAGIGALIGAGRLQAGMVASLVGLLILVGVEGIEKLFRGNGGRGSGTFGTMDGS